MVYRKKLVMGTNNSDFYCYNIEFIFTDYKEILWPCSFSSHFNKEKLHCLLIYRPLPLGNIMFIKSILFFIQIIR